MSFKVGDNGAFHDCLPAAVLNRVDNHGSTSDDDQDQACYQAATPLQVRRTLLFFPEFPDNRVEPLGYFPIIIVFRDRDNLERDSFQSARRG